MQVNHIPKILHHPDYGVFKIEKAQELEKLIEEYLQTALEEGRNPTRVLIDARWLDRLPYVLSERILFTFRSLYVIAVFKLNMCGDIRCNQERCGYPFKGVELIE